MFTAFDWDRGGAGACCGALYGAMLFGFALIPAYGASTLPFAVFGAPLSLVPLPWAMFAVLVVWPLGGLLLGGTSRRAWPLIFMLTHAAAVGSIVVWGSHGVSSHDQEAMLTELRPSTGNWIPLGCWLYGIGQLAAWAFLVGAKRRPYATRA